MCAIARQANPQALYDWMEVNIGDAAGRHRELIPMVWLCSANRDKYAASTPPATSGGPPACNRPGRQYTFTWSPRHRTPPRTTDCS
jgi:chitin-binding protein